MKLLENIEKMVNSTQCYSGLNGVKETNNGFRVALKLSDKILDLSSKGHRPRKVDVSVSKDRVEIARDLVNIKEEDRNIVGLTHLINSSKNFVKANNISCIVMSLTLLEIKDYKKMYIQIVEFSIIK